jgi:hypothetical protein
MSPLRRGRMDPINVDQYICLPPLLSSCMFTREFDTTQGGHSFKNLECEFKAYPMGRFL